MTSAADLGLVAPTEAPAGAKATPEALGLVAPQQKGGLGLAWDVLTGMADPVVGAVRLGAHALAPISKRIPEAVDRAAQEREQTYGLGNTWARLLGNVVSPVNLGIGAAATRGAGMMGGGLGARLGAAAAGGAAGGVLDPAGEKDAAGLAKSAGFGAAAGGALGAAGEAVGRAIAPRMGQDAAQLASRGVQMTPGQMVRGPAGIAKGFEDRLSGFPVLGDFIRNARGRSIRSFNTATINQALEPIGATLPRGTAAGNDAVRSAGNTISKAYDDVLARIPQVVPDQGLLADLGTVASQARSNPDVWSKYQGIVKHELTDPLTAAGGHLPGTQIQRIDSELKRQARGYLRSEDFDKRELGSRLMETRAALMDAIERQHPAVAPDLQKANQAWAMLTRVEQAAGRRRTSGGVFTPNDLLNASASQAGGLRRGGVAREFARGDALFQDWAQTAQRVLPSTIPDSGTAGRLLAEHPLSATAFGLATSPLDALYTGPGGRLFQGYMTPGATREAIRSGAGTAGTMGAPAAGEIEARRRRRRKAPEFPYLPPPD